MLLLLLAGCTAMPPRDAVIGMEDPWQWLEGGREAPSVARWHAGREDEATQWFRAHDADGQSARWREALTTRWQMPRRTAPQLSGPSSYYFHNTGTDDHYVWYRADGAAPDADAVRLLDPQLWPTGDRLEQVLLSPDGDHMAYRRYLAGPGHSTWYVGTTGADRDRDRSLSDLTVEMPVWHHDGSGLWAIADSPDCRLVFVSLHDDEHNDHCFQVSGSAGQPLGATALYLLADTSQLLVQNLTPDGVTELLLLSADGARAVESRVLISDAEGLQYVATQGEALYFISYRDTWYGELISARVTETGVTWEVLVPAAEALLNRAVPVRGGMLLEYLEHAVSELVYWSLETQTSSAIKLPDYGRIREWHVTPDAADVYMGFDGLAQPPVVLRFNVPDQALLWHWSAPVPEHLHALEVQRLFVDTGAGDGRKAPVYIAGRQDVPGARPSPLLLESYGGFNLVVDTGYSVSRAAWMDRGGLFAVAAVRGGGEYDAAWYRGGARSNRQNSIDDLLAVAEALVNLDITVPGYLALGGRSHGATLAAAAAAQRPELFSALLVDSGVMDLLRFPQSGAGSAWLVEYGDPADTHDALMLASISPYHRAMNALPGCHPATLVIAAPDDPVVSAWHSHKYVAALQHALKGQVPVLFSETRRPGHEDTGQVRVLIEDYARRWHFLSENLPLHAEGMKNSLW